MTPQQLAKVVLEAARIREESWAGLDYEITLDDAIIQAVKTEGLSKDFWYPISLAFHWWNDLIAWAENVQAGKPNSFKDVYDSLLDSTCEVEDLGG